MAHRRYDGVIGIQGHVEWHPKYGSTSDEVAEASTWREAKYSEEFKEKYMNSRFVVVVLRTYLDRQS